MIFQWIRCEILSCTNYIRTAKCVSYVDTIYSVGIKPILHVISCALSLGIHLSQGAGFHQACLMFARCLLDRVNGVLTTCVGQMWFDVHGAPPSDVQGRSHQQRRIR